MIRTRRAPRAPTLSREEGVREAYTAHGAELYRFALRSLRDAGAAQDVVQETFLRAWRSSDRYDPSLSSLRVWLFSIARNVVIDHSRSDRIRDEERRSSSGRTVRTAAISVLATAAVAAAVVAGLGLAGPDSAPTVPLEAVQVVETGGIQATADLVDHTWGVEVKLTATGLQPGGRYEVSILGADGSEFAAGAFVGTGGEVRCNLNAAVLRDQATGFVVRDQGGEQVLRSEFPA